MDKDLKLTPTNTRKLYHGTNTLFDKFDTEKSGGMTNFTQDPNVARMYAEDLGSSGRGSVKLKDTVIRNVDTGEEFFLNPESKLWESSKGNRYKRSDFQDLMDEGEGYFVAYPKNARIIEKDVDISKILDTYPDRSKRYFEQANKPGLEAFLDTVDAKLIENKVNPQFTELSQRYVDRIKRSAVGELKNIPGEPGFGNTFWGLSKLSKGDEIGEAFKGIKGQLRKAGYEGIRFADESYPTTALFDPNKNPGYLKKYLDIIKSKSGRLGQILVPVAKPIGYGLTALGAAGYADQAGAAVDMATGPLGGVEEMGVSPEQKMLDQRYLQKIRSMQQGKK